MSINVGNTRIEKQQIDSQQIYLKREDLNPSGSFKDRLLDYIWVELTEQVKSGKKIILSSSGNLAISLLYFAQGQADFKGKIRIFISDNLPIAKLNKLQQLANNCQAEVIVTDKPKSAAFQAARFEGNYLLRATDRPEYSAAYFPLAKEIISFEDQSNTKFDAVIICCSSGTATSGIIQELSQQKRNRPVFIVQTSHINSIAKEFDSDFTEETETLANAIADRVAKNKNQIVDLIKSTVGGGVVVNNQEITAAITRLEETALNDVHELTGNFVLPFAGLAKLQKKGYNLMNPLLIISGY